MGEQTPDLGRVLVGNPQCPKCRANHPATWDCQAMIEDSMKRAFNQTPALSREDVKGAVERLGNACGFNRDGGMGDVRVLKADLRTVLAVLASRALGGGEEWELTHEMLEAGIASLGSDDDRSSPEVVSDLWAAMIQAAPGKEG